MKKFISIILLSASFLLSSSANAAWLNTGYLTTIAIHMDNGKTYFTGFTPSGTCQNNRLELRETGGYYSNVENAKRMYALVLAAKMAGKPIRLGYNDADGPACRLSQVHIQW